MKLYKLTDSTGKTFNETQWGENVTHTAPGGGELCTNRWLHAYTDPDLAVLLNPIHGNFKNPRLWECEGEVGINDKGLKVGCTRLTTLREIPLPVWDSEERTRFAILLAKQVFNHPSWSAWADHWLSGGDRTAKAAHAAADAADAAAYAVADAAARAATNAAYAAAYAADAAARAAARSAARAAAHAAAYAAAHAAAYAAHAAADAREATTLDFRSVIPAVKEHVSEMR